jgi:FkbM family methyltransferase
MGSPSPIVVFGAGKLGRRVARAVAALAFCDNNDALWGASIDGLPVISPSEAIRQFPDATFVVAIWHPSRTESMTDRIAQLRALGAERVSAFTALLPAFGDLLLPHFFWATPTYYAWHEEEIARARVLFDAAGRDEFDRQMQLRTGDHSGQIIDAGIQYFPNDLFRLSDDEIFVDCGAYDGDTIAEFRRVSNDHFAHLVAFEPDSVNFSALQAAVNGDSRITLRPYATGGRRERLRFSNAGTGSHISPSGTCEIEAITLDEALGDLKPTYIKYDIEGSELDALDGAQETISRHHPKLAVCVYHLPDDLWRIPLRLHELLPDSLLSLRTYAADGFECVCYCVPR